MWLWSVWRISSSQKTATAPSLSHPTAPRRGSQKPPTAPLRPLTAPIEAHQNLMTSKLSTHNSNESVTLSTMFAPTTEVVGVGATQGQLSCPQNGKPTSCYNEAPSSDWNSSDCQSDRHCPRLSEARVLADANRDQWKVFHHKSCCKQP